MSNVQNDPAFVAVKQFADLMLQYGRDEYGPMHSPLFAGQLNVATRRIPAGTAEDPGLLKDNREVAGCQAFCQNLLFDFGLLDVLQALSRVTGEAQYDAARRDYLEFFLSHCRHPQSGYFPWGEHVGFDLVRDAIHQGDYKGWHEVKGLRVPWDQLWAANADATRHEIEVVFFNHLCDKTTFTFNRHARMDGTPNWDLQGPCSLACSAGLYLQGWCWLYRKTGERKFLDWALKINRLYWDRRSPTTNLFASSEGRPEELWYADVLTYAILLLDAGRLLGEEGDDFRKQALTYLESYLRYAYDPAGPGFFDTLNIVTGQAVIGPSKHYPSISRPKHLVAWRRVENSTQLAALATTAAMAYADTSAENLKMFFDRAYALMDVPTHIQKGTPMVAGDAAGVLAGLVHVAHRSGHGRYLEEARRLAGRLLQTNCRNGFFISGLEVTPDYYSARLGAGDLAAALLGYALAVNGRTEHVPPIRNPWGAMPW